MLCREGLQIPLLDKPELGIVMTPQEAKEFRKACNAIRKHIPDDNETPAMFELVVLRIVGKALVAL